MVIKLGKATHFKTTKGNACGIISKNAAWDARDCNCFNCMRTKAYKKYIGKKGD